MDESTIVFLSIVGGVLITIIIGLLIVMLIWRSVRLEKERQMNERIIAVEELKTEKARLANDKAAIYANRDLTAAQIEAGVFGNARANTSEDEGGLGDIMKYALPFLAQMGANKTPAGGGEAPQNGATFPTDQPVNA